MKYIKYYMEVTAVSELVNFTITQYVLQVGPG